MQRANAELEQRVAHRTQELEYRTQELERFNNELDQFTYVASHDLQEPVRNLVSYSTLLKEDLGDVLSENAAEDLFYITSAASRMQQLVQDLLALSRAGRAPVKTESVDLNDCLNHALDALRIRIDEAEAEVTVKPLPTVVGDATLLTQLYQNLLGNALKFVGDERPVIHLTVERQDDMWTLGVRDNGIGLAPELPRSTRNRFSNRSSVCMAWPLTLAPVLGSPSVKKQWSGMAVAFGSSPSRDKGLISDLPFPPPWRNGLNPLRPSTRLTSGSQRMPGCPNPWLSPVVIYRWRHPVRLAV
ncbi:sensor histidine kinase [Candidatus Entotheonella palauensis]|uniref:sensor histidine kinase n=1 Tax=Candidatus Entotheonella palauensis TaxID=93172 RepID=UPI003FA42777